jgi:hypothetical protein
MLSYEAFNTTNILEQTNSKEKGISCASLLSTLPDSVKELYIIRGRGNAPKSSGQILPFLDAKSLRYHVEFFRFIMSPC